MWLFLALFSAFFLGIYDVFKKLSLRNNAVLPVLLTACITMVLIMTPQFLLSRFYPEIIQNTPFYIPQISFAAHRFIMLKSVIVITSWIFSYYALKHLPITVVSPIRATAPLWTLLGAIAIFNEQLSTGQWIGTLITLLFFYLFSIEGKKDGLDFFRNKWIWFIIIGTLVGSVSALYDKFLLKFIDKMAVQFWFTVYQIFLLIPVLMVVWFPYRKNNPFEWRWVILLISLFLLIADFAYFYALSLPNSLISIISPIRRSGVIIAFAVGAIVFHEKNITKRLLLLMGILAGISVIVYFS